MTIARTTLLASLFAFGGAANAAQHEVSLELGSITTPDPTWDLFDYGMTSTTQGVRVGYGYSDRITIIGSWHHDATGGEVSTVDGDYYGESDFGLAFYGNQFAVGPKVQHRLKSWLAPYATAQLMLLHGKIKMDDRMSDDDNANQLSFSSMAPGANLSAGVDFMPIELRGGMMRLASHLEFGYGYVMPLNFTADGEDSGSSVDLGDLSFNGLTVRWGVGLRF